MTPTPSLNVLGTRRMIVIDDDPAVRESLRILLETRFEQVRDFSSAEEFLAVRARDDAVCLIVDVDLPGIDGIDLVAHLASVDGDVRAILISGCYDEAMRRRAAHIGVVDLLDKPVTFDALLAAIARMSD